jgi:hypothetical protein
MLPFIFFSSKVTVHNVKVVSLEGLGAVRLNDRPAIHVNNNGTVPNFWIIGCSN